MPSQVFNRHYWSARELVVLGVFSAAAKLSTLLVALVGGGMNPVSLLAKNLIFTTLLVVMLYKVRKPGTLALFVLVNMLISMLLLGGSVTLLPAMLLAAGLCVFLGKYLLDGGSCGDRSRSLLFLSGVQSTRAAPAGGAAGAGYRQ